MQTKESLKADLQRMGIDPRGTLLVHSSYKSIGPVEGGPEAVLDALAEYMAEGLLVLPTHTWASIDDRNPRFYVRDTPSCVGALTELFRKRPGVVRSLHPTHSVAALGKDAREFAAGDELSTTPCGYGTAWRRLWERKAAILLVGVDLRRNTFMHGVEEWADVPGRLSDGYQDLITVLPDDTEIQVPSRRHFGDSSSENFGRAEEVFLREGVMFIDRLGQAETRVCDSVKMTSVLLEMLRENPGLFSSSSE